MHETEEQDTCRICSAPAEPDQPLFHPCKCSGTIRYIHQDCLTTWLAHSKKKNCDVCKYPYSFTKVYAPDMPAKLPTFLVLRRLLYQGLLGILFLIRGIAVATIWLGVLPWVTVWTWRMYFSMGESTAWWISDRPRPETDTSNSPFFQKIRQGPSSAEPKSAFSWITSHPVWISLPADIFTGQIIASLIVLIFVAVFLLREWISQNARPGVFEDEPIPDDPIPQQPPQQHPPPVVVQNNVQQPFVWQAPPAPVVQRPPTPPRHVPAPPDFVEHDWVRQRIEDDNDERNWVDVGDDGEQGDFGGRKKRVRKTDRPRPTTPGRAKPPVELDNKLRLQRKRFATRALKAKLLVDDQPVDAPLEQRPPERAKFDFTFRTPSPSTPSFSSELPSPFPNVELQPPTTSIPHPLIQSRSESSSSLHDPYQTPTQDHPTQPSYFDAFESEESGPSIPGPSSGSSSQQSYDMFMGSGNESDEEERTFDDYVDDEDEELNYRLPHEPEPEPLPYLPFESDFAQAMMKEEHRRYFIEGDTETPPQPGPSSASEATVPVPEKATSGTTSETDSDEESGEDDPLAGMPHLDEMREEEEDEENEGFDDDDDDVEWEAVVPEGLVEGVPPRVAVVDQNRLADDAALAAALDANEVPDGDDDNDMEGAMEAIGMRGPIYGVFQNAALMIFVLDTAIGLGVWAPFTIGKTAALLSLDPRRFLQVLHLPIRAMRLVTDPIVDMIAYVTFRLVVPRLLHVFKAVLRVFSLFGLDYVTNKLSGKATDRLYDFSYQVYNQSAEGLEKIVQSGFWNGNSVPANTSEQLANATVNPEFFDSVVDHLGFTEPYFAALGEYLRIAGTNLRLTWVELSLGSGPKERFFAVSLGYLVLSLLFSVYLNLLNVGNVRSTGIAVRNAVRQQLLVLKVAAFIFIELVLFPLGCGIVLDLCTVWLFPGVEMTTRVAFFLQAPLTAVFFHWLAGTMFMYSFAVLLSGCRVIMRPGAMWFIKDPQDPNSHPIRDILDRPALTQLKKIGISGGMYSFVVFCVVGSIAGLLFFGRPALLPFRWKSREPLSSVPVDLTFLHLVLPYTMRYFQPKTLVKYITGIVWKFLAERFRLTSYFFGDRYPSEEYTPSTWSEWFHKLAHPDNMPPSDVEVKQDGTFRRVPATDNLALPRDMRATAQVDEQGIPVDEASKKLFDAQNAEALKAKHLIEEDYRVVYIPPKFRWRVIGFITLLWVWGTAMLGVGVSVPILLGRGVFRLSLSKEVHDGYSFILGFYLLWACYLVGRSIDRLDKRRQRSRSASSGGPRPKLYVLVLKRGSLWAAKTAYMVLMLGVVAPILLAVVVDLYLVFPLRFVVDPGMQPKIRVVDNWVLGLLYAKIVLHVERLQPPNRISRGWRNIRHHGWTHPNPAKATVEFIAPLVGGLVAMIVLPAVCFLGFRFAFPNVAVDDRFLFVHVYPTMFVLAGALRMSITLFDMLSTWSQSIRDKEFLVEMRLRNHEPERDEVRDMANGFVGTAEPDLIEAVVQRGG